MQPQCLRMYRLHPFGFSKCPLFGSTTETIFLHLGYLVAFNHLQDRKQEIKFEWPYFVI